MHLVQFMEDVSDQIWSQKKKGGSYGNPNGFRLVRPKFCIGTGIGIGAEIFFAETETFFLQILLIFSYFLGEYKFL